MRPTAGAGNGGGAKCWFKFGSRGADAEGAGIYGSQSRDDFDRNDVEQVYFFFFFFFIKFIFYFILLVDGFYL